MAYSPSRSRHTSHQSVLTTGATVTTIKTIPVKLNSIFYISAIITGVRTGGSAGAVGDAACYHIEAGAKNSAGTAVQMGSNTVLKAVEDVVGWAADITESGGNMLVRVTGAANTDITWNAKIEVIENV